MSILLKRLEALEAEKAAALASHEDIDALTDTARAARLWQHVHCLGQQEFWHLIQANAKTTGWPYYRDGNSPLTGHEPRVAFLRFDALEPILDTCGNRVFELLLEMARRRQPHEGGKVDVYYKDGDGVPFVSFWFEPANGADLL